MSDIAIRVENLSKLYRLGQIVGYSTLREDLTNAVTAPFRKLRQTTDRREETAVPGLPSSVSDSSKYIWALKNISFEVKQGEALGIIGSNGSGKTTILKILSRITAPTEGYVELHGRVGSLLEVGTGFHPELTGRENIYLNGAIIGMKRAEIKSKLDEIVEFSEIEKFIDTPIKRYSTGMYVRLAFSVAAHLEPDILLVDEVLSVGDAAFQQKCLGKMGAEAQRGRTVVFVSHNMGAIREMCPISVWIDNGSIVESGASSSIIDSYLQLARRGAATPECQFAEDPEKDFQLLSARLLNDEGALTQSFICDKPVIIDILCKSRRPVPGLYGYLLISKKDGTRVMESDSYDTAPNPLDGLPAGMYSTRVTIPMRTLGPGDYDVYFNFTSISSLKGFNVDSPGVVGSFHLDDSTSRRGNQRNGFFSTRLTWDISPL